MQGGLFFTNITNIVLPNSILQRYSHINMTAYIRQTEQFIFIYIHILQASFAIGLRMHMLMPIARGRPVP